MSRLEISELNRIPTSDQPEAITATEIEDQPLHRLESYDDSLDLDLIIGHQWSTGLFDCREDARNAIVTAFLPCVTFGQIAQVLDEGESGFWSRSLLYLLLMMASYSQWVMSTEYRTKLRKKFNLEEAPYTDVAAHIFCPCCSLCQEFRELKNRQLDPALGWNGILAHQQSDGEPINAPPTNQVMSK